MAFEATTQLYQREADLLNARAQQETNRYLSDLARQFGIAQGNLNANLEGRGIYRSGEAATARTRLSAENQAMRSAALQDLEYRRNMNQINLLKQLASLQASRSGSGTNNSNFNPPAQTAPKPPYYGFNPYQPYTALPKTPTTTTTTKSSTFYPTTRFADAEERRVSYAGR